MSVENIEMSVETFKMNEPLTFDTSFMRPGTHMRFIEDPWVVRYRLLSPDAQLPVLATSDSAAADVFAYLPVGREVTVYSSKNERHVRTITDSQMVRVEQFSRVLIPLGWAVAVPSAYSMRIYSRSGLTLKQGLVVANGQGIVDADYRHEVFALVTNIGGCTVEVRHGERIAQMDITPILSMKQTVVEMSDDEWFTTDRTGGFGSTGVR
jgi:dUTP pyrophosphatase